MAVVFQFYFTQSDEIEFEFFPDLKRFDALQRAFNILQNFEKENISKNDIQQYSYVGIRNMIFLYFE